MNATATTPRPAAPPPRVLVIEDEPALQRFLRATLASQGYGVVEAARGEDGLRLAAASPPDLVVLDLGLPDVDGVEVTRRLREWTGVPIIVVSARGREQDKVVALDAGADDYLTKPFGVGELLARVRAAMRRAAAARHDTGEAVFESGDLRVDLARREVSAGGRPVRLTPIEYKLLAALVRNAGRVMTHRQLLKEVWGPESVEENHYVRVYMNNLRNKLEPEPARPKHLLTEAGVGYRLAAAPE
jgi:two-component system KDP operon response regulator KdpE